MTIEDIPKNLEEDIAILISTSKPGELRKFSSIDEDSAIATAHFSVGRWLRNEWGLWDTENSPLVKYFLALGIDHADDMSSIILVSLHRRLNGKPIELVHQVRDIQLWWKSMCAPETDGE